MYPKPIHDLAGYNIATLAGGSVRRVSEREKVVLSMFDAAFLPPRQVSFKLVFLALFFVFIV